MSGRSGRGCNSGHVASAGVARVESPAEFLGDSLRFAAAEFAESHDGILGFDD
jgi:hypothetical protein